MLFRSKKFVHKCTLPEEQSTLSNDYKRKHRLKYILRKLFLISSNENHRKNYRRSSHAAEKERVSHLKHYQYIIHPFSMFRFYWELLMSFIFITRMVFDSQFLIVSSALTTVWAIYVNVDWFTTSLCLLDICLSFWTGYYDDYWCGVVMKQKKIARRYLFTYFLTDLLSSFPFQILNFIHSDSIITKYRYAFIFMKSFHIFRLWKYLNNLQKKREYSEYKFKLFLIILLYMIGYGYFTAAIGFATVYDYNLLFYNLSYKKCLISASNMVFGLGNNTLLLYNLELIIHIIGRFFGIIINIVFIAQVVSVSLAKKESEFLYEGRMLELDEYMRNKRLSPKLMNRLINYHEFIYNKHWYDESEIWSHVSDDVKCIAFYDILKKQLTSDIFSYCTKNIIYLLIPHLSKLSVVGNDVVTRANTASSSVILIHSGSIALVSSHAHVAAVICEGHIFCDLAPVENVRQLPLRKYTLIATENSELYYIRYKYLLDVLADFPNVYDNVIEALRRKTELINQTDDDSDLNLNLYYKL